MIGRVGPHSLELHEAVRFPNHVVDLSDGLHWDIVGIYQKVLNGLAEAVRRTHDVGGIASVGVDSWAVDYGLLTGRDSHRMSLLGAPFHYRDPRTTVGVDRVHSRVPFAELYGRNGLQFLPFNTIYQLAAEGLLDSAAKLLLIPDLMGYWLTGQQLSEKTNASTTGLLNVHTQSWDAALMTALGLDPGWFAPVADPGTALGPTRAAITEVLGAELPVTLVGSHDTASAVVGTPLSTPDSAYISCGTWGLVGLELESPVVTAASREANFTNEGGVDGTTRFLTNVMGTWLLSESLRSWQRQSGRPESLASLLAEAAEVPPGRVVVFDVQDPRFVAPGDMPGRIAELCEERSQPAPRNKPEMVRSIVESIAARFAQALDDASRLAEKRIDTVHLVGGGSLNALLCQATADRSGRTVIAGPVEATAIGNLLIQARSAGSLSGDLMELRQLITRTQELSIYHPR